MQIPPPRSSAREEAPAAIEKRAGLR